MGRCLLGQKIRGKNAITINGQFQADVFRSVNIFLCKVAVVHATWVQDETWPTGAVVQSSDEAPGT